MLVSISGVSKYYGERLILKDLNLSIEDNDRIGLIGANGAGKSTLLQMICDGMEYDTAQEQSGIGVKNGVTIGFLRQNAGLNKNNSIYTEMRSVFSSLNALEQKLRDAERRMADITDRDSEEYRRLMAQYAEDSAYFEHQEGYQIDLKIKTVLTGMGFSDKSYDFNIAALSGGEKTRLALAKLLLEQPQLLVLDEPTNHLDFRTLNWLEEYLKDYKGGLLIVSHDRYFLDKMVTKIWEIEDKTIVAYKGNYSKYKILREERLKRLEKEYSQQQEEIAALQEYIDRNIARASTAASARSRIHKLEAMEIIEKPYIDRRRPHFSFTYEREPVKDVLIAEHLKLNVGIGDEKLTLFNDVNLHIRRGEKVAVIGENGVGKSTLLKSLIGILRQPGEITWGRNVTLGYYDQENQNLSPDKTVLQELWERYPTMPEFEVRKILGSVLITDDNVYKKIKVISGGEKAKVGLAALMTEHRNTLLLDEPTNHLDLQSKEALEEGLQAFTGTLIFVSHDRYFLNAVPTKIIELCAKKEDPQSQETRIYNGNYDFYMEQKALEQQEIAAEKAAPAPEKEGAKSYYRSKEQRRADAKKRADLKAAEERLEQLDNEIAEAEGIIAAPENANNFLLLTEQCERLETLKNTHENVMEEWLALSEEVDQIGK